MGTVCDVNLPVRYLRVFEADVAVGNQPLPPLVQPLPPVLRHAVVHQQGVVLLEGQLPPCPALKVVQRYSLKDLSICSKQNVRHTLNYYVRFYDN